MHEQNAEYVTNGPMTEVDVLNKASEILETKFLKGEGFTSPSAAKDFLRYKLAHQKREVFAILLMDSQHRLIEYKELFFGTINAAPVYPREVMKEVLQQNACFCSHQRSPHKHGRELSMANRRSHNQDSLQ